MHPALSFLLLFLLPFATAASAAVNPSLLPEAEVCEEDLVMLSPCLPYVAAQPNSPTPAPSVACCRAISALRSAAACLCYVVRDPFLLGFPVNDTRVAGLFFSCSHPSRGRSNPAFVVVPGRSDAAFVIDPHSFYEKCRGLKTLPPFHNSTPERNSTTPSHESTPGADYTSPVDNSNSGTNYTIPTDNSTAGIDNSRPMYNPPGRNSSTPSGGNLDSPSVHKPGPAPQPDDSQVLSSTISEGQAAKICCSRNFLVAVIVCVLLSMIS